MCSVTLGFFMAQMMDGENIEFYNNRFFTKSLEMGEKMLNKSI